VKSLISVLIVALLLALPVSAQTVSVSNDTNHAHLDALRRSGIEALYNLDYDKAQRDFQEIARLYPDHPVGPLLLASRVWLKSLYESRRLQSSLYNSDNFYATGDDKVDPQIVTDFRNYTRQSRRLAEARLKQNPRDVEALDLLASTEGLKASFEEAVERRHFAALKDGDDAVDHHREVLKLDPNFIDAQLTIGLYEYVVGSLALPVKLLAGVTGFHGSKRRGFEMLERVAKDGRWAQDDAKTLLIILYTRERHYDDALRFARELSAKYARNYLFRLEIADALVGQAELKRKANYIPGAVAAEHEAFATFDELLRDKSVRETVARALDLVHFKYGEVLLAAGEADRAAREFLAATRVPHAEPALVTMAHLFAARALDLSGKRDDALGHYREVLARPDIYGAHDDAKKGIRETYKSEVAKVNGS
jgi:tetratricopeptide (TPR) repeat protein